MKNLFDTGYDDETTSERTQTEEFYGTFDEEIAAASDEDIPFGTLLEQKAFDGVDVEESFDEPEEPLELTGTDHLDLSQRLSSWLQNSEEWLKVPRMYFKPTKKDKGHPGKIHDHLPEYFDEIFTVGKGMNRVGIVMTSDGAKQQVYSGIGTPTNIPKEGESLGMKLLLGLREYEASRVKTDPFTMYAEMMDGWTYNPTWLNRQHKSSYEQERNNNIAPISDYLIMLPKTEEGLEFAGKLLEKVPDMMEFTRSYGKTLDFVENICRLAIKDMRLAENIVDNSIDIMIEQGYKKLDDFMTEHLG